MASSTDDTDLRRRLDLDKLSAEVSKTLAETVRLSEAQRESGPRFEAEVEKMKAESAKARAEADKLSRERGWYPYLQIATLIAAVIGAYFAPTRLH